MNAGRASHDIPPDVPMGTLATPEQGMLPSLSLYLIKGLKRISNVLMNMVGCTIYNALIFFLYLKEKQRE